MPLMAVRDAVARDVPMSARLERGAFVALLLAAAGWPLSTAVKELGVALAAVAWLAHKIVTRTRPPRLGAMLPLAFWFVVALLSMSNSVSLEASLRGLQKILKAVVIIYMAADLICTKRRLAAVLTAVAAGVVVGSLDGLAQLLLGRDLVEGNPPGIAVGQIPRLSGAFGHANDFGVYAVTVLPWCLSLALSATSPRGRWGGWAMTGLLGVATVFTFSRSAALALVVSLLVFGLLRRAWRLIAVGGLALLAAVFALPAEIRAWAASQGSWFNMLVMPQRPDMWRTALNMIHAHPFIGVGVNTFVLNYARFRPSGDPVTAAYAHNQYLHRAAETGLLGLAALCWLLVSTALAWRRIAREHDAWTSTVMAGIGCGLIGFLTMGLLESALQSSHTNFGFWMGIGILQGWAVRPPARSV